MSSIKNETLNGVAWGVVQKLTLQPIQLLYGVLLARLITPAEMGILGLTSLFFAIAASLKDAGFGEALIRKQDRTEEDINTVFWFNMASNFVVAIMFYLCAPLLADFFNQPALLWLTRVSAFMVLVNGAASIHFTLFHARRDFKIPAITNLVATIVAMPVTLYTAYIGWSYWAVMMQGIVTGLVSFIIIWWVSPWRPKLMFSKTSFKEFFAFGSKLAFSGCIWCVYSEIVNFIIGKFYSPAHLALYSRANQLGSLPGTTFFEPIGRVMYPILSTIHNDVDRLKRVYRKFLRLSMMMMTWIVITLACHSDSIVVLLYGDSWLGVVPYLQILCLGYLFSPIIRVSHAFLAVSGRSDLILKREVFVRVVSLVALVAAAYHSVLLVCWAFVASNVYNLMITLYFYKLVTKDAIIKQFFDFLPYVVLCMLANVPGWLMQDWCGCVWILSIVGPFLSICIYYSLLKLFRDVALLDFIDLVLGVGFVQRLLTKIGYNRVR